MQSKIIFVHADDSRYVVSMYGEAEPLHALAAAIKHRTLKDVIVETETPLTERMSYAPHSVPDISNIDPYLQTR